MRTNFVIAAANGTYTSPINKNINTLDTFGNIITFEFYNDAALTIPSTGMTGSITVNGKMSANSIWQNIPNSSEPTTIDVANALSLSVNQAVYQLQIITNTLANTNFVNIILDSTKST